MVFDANDLSHFGAFNRTRHWGPCVVALACLAMGDCHAVELAQQSHFEVLRTLAGCLIRTEVVAFRQPFPPGGFLEFLCIDDHVSVQILSRAAALRGDPARDTRVFGQSHIAYEAVGLHPHPKKCQRNLQQATLLGADIDGVEGFVSAPRERTLLLMLCTAEIARRGTCTPKLLNVLLGCWIHVLTYRRPALCILDQCFKDAARLPSDVVTRLSQRTRNELLLVAIMGPLLQTDLRTGWCPDVFCMDASPTGAGLCSAPVPENAVAELHRYSEQRGFYTKLEAPSSAALREMGFYTEPVYLDAESPAPPLELPLPRSLSEGILYDCCELCHEPETWSSAHAALGLTVLKRPCLGSSGVKFGDFGEASLFRELVALALRRVVRDWRCGPPPLSFCTSWRPALRSKRCPSGIDDAEPLTAAHNKLGIRLGFLLCIVASTGCFYSVEQPGSSLLLKLDCFTRLLQLGGQLAKFCYCSFGCACAKSTVWLHNKPWMLDLPRGCSCSSPDRHFPLRGQFDEPKLRAFEESCSPSCGFLFGRTPALGEEVRAFLLGYPAALTRQLAAGSLAAKAGRCKPFPLSARWGAAAVLRQVSACRRSLVLSGQGSGSSQVPFPKVRPHQYP